MRPQSPKSKICQWCHKVMTKNPNDSYKQWDKENLVRIPVSLRRSEREREARITKTVRI